MTTKTGNEKLYGEDGKLMYEGELENGARNGKGKDFE